MILKADLHVHSCHSPDGAMPADEIIKCAKAKGLSAVAICDHDRVFTDNIDSSDVAVIRGSEFSTEYGHLLGLFLTNNIEKSDFKTLCDSIHSQGGIAVLAHPYEHLKYKDRIEEIVKYLDAIEVYNSRAARKNKDANKMAKALADKYGLRCFAGSDAHIACEIGNAYITVECNGDIKDALLNGSVTVIGKLSPARYIAKSQLVKLKKQEFSLKKYVIWLAFYVKCILTDLIKEK